MKNNIITVYFDTNVYDQIFKNNEKTTTNDIEFFENEIKNERVRLSYSVFNLEEILMQPDDKQTKEEMSLLKKLVYPYYFIKSPFELIKECLLHGVNKNKSFYYVDDVKFFLNVQDYINNGYFDNETREKTQTQKNEFTKGIKKVKEKTLTEIKNENKKRYSFDDFEKSAEKLLGDFINDFNIKRDVLDKLDYITILKNKIIKVWIYSNLAIMYKQIVKGTEPRSGDSRDLLHCISASTADIFVTHDSSLRKRLELFTTDDFKVCDFNEFIQILKK